MIFYPNPLQKVIVVKGDTKYLKHSTGYAVITKPRKDGVLSWCVNIVFNRRGKKGKERIECASLYMPIEPELTKKDQDLFNKIKVHERMDPKYCGGYIMKQGSFGRKAVLFRSLLKNLKLELVDPPYKSLLEFSVYEFTAYMTALSYFVKEVTKFATMHPKFRYTGTPMSVFGDIAERSADVTKYVGLQFNQIPEEILPTLLADAETWDRTTKMCHYVDNFLSYFEDGRIRRRIIEATIKQLIACRESFSKLLLATDNHIDLLMNEVCLVLDYYKKNKRFIREMDHIDNLNNSHVRINDLKANIINCYK